MIVSVIGTPDSGKSKIAEEILCSLAGHGHRYYIATMIPYGEYGENKIKKHRAMRAEKGFETIEQPCNLTEALPLIRQPQEAGVLLECVSNLVANEMFEKEQKDPKLLADKITAEIKELAAGVKDLVVVANQFALTPEYDEETRQYIAAMTAINENLAAFSDRVERPEHESV